MAVTQPKVVLWNATTGRMEAWTRGAFMELWDSLHDDEKTVFIKSQWGEAAVGLPISKLIHRMPIEPMRRYTDNIREAL